MDNQYLLGSGLLPFWNVGYFPIRLKELQEIALRTTNEEILLADVQTIKVTGLDRSEEHITSFQPASDKLVVALKLRERYMSLSCQSFPGIMSKHLEIVDEKERIKDGIKANYPNYYGKSATEDEPIVMIHGVVDIFDTERKMKECMPDRSFFIQDQNFMFELINDGPLRSLCETRLGYLSNKFNMHILLNSLNELAEQKTVRSKDFYNITKVDTHVHAAACMNQKQFLKFIQTKVDEDTRLVFSGNTQTLKQVFEELKLDPKKLNIDMLGVHADRKTFNRFDVFNEKYNPIGQSRLRDIFFKTDNEIGGQYFAEIIKAVENQPENECQKAEYRLSIYGRDRNEWENLARWADEHDMNATLQNVRWLIQVPRLYDVYKKNSSPKKPMKNFEQMLTNIFLPLFEATSDPDKHAELHRFLANVTGFDSVDDESKSEYIPFTKDTPEPDAWDKPENPPYTYYLYYMYANLTVLNKLRRKQKMNTFVLRPHCGEAGNITHLVAGFLCAESISHGVTLRQVPALEYLYYLSQIGIAMSPMSNNALFTKYQFNPLPDYFFRGLNISLSTDDPMLFHFTKEPLMEEYSIAASIWNLSSCDMCEIARNSVLQSGFKDEDKIEWIGKNYKKDGKDGNDVEKTNVPHIRLVYRTDTLKDELDHILRGALRLATVRTPNV